MKMSNMKTFALAILAVTLIAVPSIAGGYHHHGCGAMMKDMTAMDQNGDNFLTFEEFRAPQDKNLRAAFDMLDTDNSGDINEDEWNTFLNIHGFGNNS
jgi:hypothetical protein